MTNIFWNMFLCNTFKETVNWVYKKFYKYKDFATFTFFIDNCFSIPRLLISLCVGVDRETTQDCLIRGHPFVWIRFILLFIFQVHCYTCYVFDTKGYYSNISNEKTIVFLGKRDFVCTLSSGSSFTNLFCLI